MVCNFNASVDDKENCCGLFEKFDNETHVFYYHYKKYVKILSLLLYK